MSPLTLIYKYRMLLYQTVKQEFRKRYAGSALGFVWFIAQPLMMLSAYALVYIYIFKVKLPLFTPKEYMLMIFCGLIPFLGFSESLSSGTPSVTSNAALIKNTLFPIELVPVRAVLVSHGMQAAGSIILLLAIIAVNRVHSTILLLPILWALQLMFLCGLIWILSALNVFMRDLQQIIGTIVMMLMMLSPIAYTFDMVPDVLKPIIAINPIAHFLFCYQSIIFLGQLPPMISMKIVLILSPLMFFIGYHFFVRLKRVMVDHV